jgi:hypothetical protein
MTTATSKRTRTNKLPKDRFYRRYAAAYVLGIPAASVPEYTWKDLFPRIYEVEDEGVTLEKFRNAKAQIKGLRGSQVVEMVTQAQAAQGLKPVDVAPAPAPKATITEIVHDNMPNPPADLPTPKLGRTVKPRKSRAKKLGAKVKRTATNDMDAINKLYGNKG